MATNPAKRNVAIRKSSQMNYTAAARERQQKLRRQEQRLIVIDWSELANNSIEEFTRERCLELFSTAGRRLRVLDGRKYRRLGNSEFCHLWTIIRTELDGLGVKLTVGKIEAGLKAVALTAPLPMKLARGAAR